MEGIFKPEDLRKVDFQPLTHCFVDDFNAGETVFHKTNDSLELKIERFTWDNRIECSWENECGLNFHDFIPEELIKPEERAIVRMKTEPYYSNLIIVLN